jgi:hypothetical protein
LSERKYLILPEKGHVLIDGDLIENISADAIRDMNTDVIIVCSDGR